MTLFGRNIDPDLPVEEERFFTLADENGDLAVYDSHTGRYAPFYGDTGGMVAADLNQNLDYPDRYQWKDSL